MSNKDRYKVIIQTCALLTAGIGFIAIIGWLTNLWLLHSIRPDYIPMAPSTALAFIIMGGSLFVSARWDSRYLAILFSKVSAVLVAVFALLMLIQFFIGTDFGIERLLAGESRTLHGFPIGRMSPVTAVSFLLSGLSQLLMLCVPQTLRPGRYLAVGMAAGVMITGLAIIIGYLIGTPLMYGGAVIPVAMPTAIAFVLLGSGLFAAVMPHLSLSVSGADVLVRTMPIFHGRYLPAAVVCITGALITLTLYSIVQKNRLKTIQDSFIQQTDSLSIALQRKVDKNLEVIKSVRSFFIASEKVTRHEFQLFLEDILLSNPGIQAVEWVLRVQGSERSRYEKAARMDGFKDFQFTEKDANGGIVKAGQRKGYFPVYFVEPLKGNESALGYDLASQPDRLKALEKARDTGEMTSTSGVTLVQETGQQSGILIFLPVHRHDSSYNNEEERRKNLMGFAIGVFRVGDMVETALYGISYKGIDFRLSDAMAEEKEKLLYASAKDIGVSRARFYRAVAFNMADRKWILEFYQASEVPSYLFEGALAVLSAGLLFTALLTLYLLTMERYSIALKKSLTESEKLTSELQDALARIKTLRGFVPICSYCKKIRNDKNYWEHLETYITERSEAEFTHSICPECAKKAMAEFSQMKKDKEKAEET
ncbi:MAG: CHASE domain-containing protein [Nitrospirae bacterium]|nr:CHASE domain-containing protein [Nitrospirota bacterium]